MIDDTPCKSRTVASVQAERRLAGVLCAQGRCLVSAYLGNRVRVRVRCLSGHEVEQYPQHILRGAGCRKCPREGRSTRSLGAEAEFRAELDRRRWTLLEDQWLGSNTDHRILCDKGHVRVMRPDSIRAGSRCGYCSGAAPEAGRDRFHAELKRQSAEALDPYVTTMTPIRVKCSEGHVTERIPNNVVTKRRGCRVCDGQDPITAERKWREALAAEGSRPLGPYINSGAAVETACREGHVVLRLPTHVISGHGCHQCIVEHTVFYVVRHPETGVVKLGVSSGDGRARLAAHAREGFTAVFRLAVGLPEGAAPGLERRALETLRSAGERPVRGREYFPGHCLPLILRLADATI